MTTDTLFDLPSMPEPGRILVGGPVLLIDGEDETVTDYAHDPEWGQASATFDRERAYRYALTRTWDARLPTVVFVMLNPSTADAFKVDPTVARCLRFARAWGAGTLVVLNIFALRATDPRVMRAHPEPVGALNDDAICALTGMGRVIAAWGAHGTHLGRADQVRAMLRDAGVQLEALRLTKDGHPGHPLYVPGDTQPIPF